MLRIAYCTPAPHGGGTLNYLVDLVESHDRTRYEPVVFLDRRLREARRALERLEACGVAVRTGPLARPTAFVLGAGRWRRMLEADGPFDVANLHQHVPGAGWPFLEGARRAGVPLLVRTEQLPRFPPLERGGLSPVRAALRLARRRLARITHRRIAVAEAGRRALVARGEPADTIDVIPSAFNEAAFADLPSRADARRRMDLPGDAPLVGFVANLSVQKRPDLFLRAAERLLRDGSRARFLVAGGGPLAEATADRARALGGRVLVRGATDRLPTLLAALDVFVLPSDWEGLPLTVLEAMRAGVAVVATDVDGTGEVVEDGATGRLVPAGDAAALADAIRALTDDDAERGRIAAAGRAYVSGRFDAARLARSTEALYERATAGLRRE